MSGRADRGDVTELERGRRVTLRIVASMLAHREVSMLAETSDLSAEQLRRELEAVGPLREIPKRAWEEFEAGLQLDAVPDANAVETLLPLWTESGPASRAVRVWLVPHEGSDLEDYWICGFVDVAPGKWLTVPADPIVPPEPLEILPSSGDNPVPERWRPVLSAIVHRLVVGDYQGLQRDGIVSNIDNPDKDSVKKWIEEYHDPLVDLPDNAWEWSDCFPAFDGPGAYDVLLSMWTAHQGLSLLTMEANVVDRGGDDIRVTVFSVHVT